MEVSPRNIKDSEAPNDIDDEEFMATSSELGNIHIFKT